MLLLPLVDGRRDREWVGGGGCTETVGQGDLEHSLDATSSDSLAFDCCCCCCCCSLRPRFVDWVDDDDEGTVVAVAAVAVAATAGETAAAAAAEEGAVGVAGPTVAPGRPVILP